MGFTRISELLWNWEPFTSLPSDARILWLALYTGPTARRLIPGLWQGTPNQMADESRLGAIETINALDKLLEKELVEYDPKTRVLRLTELPDAGEWPHSPTILRSWWRRFHTIPACAVRDAHVATLRWQLERGAAMSEENRSGKPSAKHEEFWAATFGTVNIPPARRRGLRHATTDTATATQPSLFPSQPLPQPRTTLTNHSNTLGYHPQYHPSTTPGGTGEGEGEGEGEGDLRSGECTSHATVSVDEQISTSARPDLGLVPLPPDLPFSIGDMLAAVASESDGRFAPGPVDDRLVGELSATIRQCQQGDVGLADLRLVGRWMAAGGIGYRTDLGPSWCAKPGNLLSAVGQARAWRDKGTPAIGTSSRAVPAAKPAPSSAFGSGRQVL